MDVSSIGSPVLWAGFVAFVLAMLALDLGVFHRRAHIVGFREAAGWSVAWVALALCFNAGIWWYFGATRAVEFLTGYVVEKSLSVDNIFVFVVIFSGLRVPTLHQHRVLYWGILGALVLRAAMIGAGAALLARFHWVMYLFGAFLVITGARLLREYRRHEVSHAQPNRLLELVRRFVPTTSRYDGARFFTIENGRRVATPMFVALVLVELSDVVFAVDSIPAVFAVTRDPFLVFTSNIFAILGLRSMFFLLANVVDRFTYLKLGLAAILTFVGVKMLVVSWVKVPPLLSLGVIAALLGAALLASLRTSRRADEVQ
jgi:tellurite resistance protein TerC